MARQGRHDRDIEFDISGDLDDRVVEALRLEIQALAKRHGLTVEDFRLESKKRAPSA